jgi:hypothetical protein
VLPAVGSTQQATAGATQTSRQVAGNAVELANTNPTALNALTSTASPSDTQQSTVPQQQVAQSGASQSNVSVTPSSNQSSGSSHSRQQQSTEIVQQQRGEERQQQRAAVPRSTLVVFAVQGDAGLTGAVSDVLSSELAASGLKVSDVDDLPATEGMSSAPASALIGRLRGTAGTLVLAKIEPTGQRELHYMGRYDVAYGSRITVTAYDVATGRPIGSRGNARVEYTQLNASREAEKAVAPLARKALEAIQNQ